MTRALRSLVATCALGMGFAGGLAFVAMTPAAAVEPEAPETLISANEAMQISLHKRLVRVPMPARPTQHQKGEAIDRQGLARFYEANAASARTASSPNAGLQTVNLDASTSGSALLWVSKDGLTPQARAAIEEIKLVGDWGFKSSDFDTPDVERYGRRPLTPAEQVDLELRVSLLILKYARYARGGQMDPKDLSLDIDRTPRLLPAKTVLQGLHDAPDAAAYLRSLHPQHEQFKALRAAWLRLRNEVADLGSEGGDKNRRKAADLRRIAQRLLDNMEMWRWMPQDLGDYYVMANIPEYRIRVIDRDRIVHSERIVVGKVENKTPVFSDMMEYVEFRPNWGIPDSIKVKEILPKLMRGRSIGQMGYRVQYNGRDVDPYSIDWGRVDIRHYHIYQPPSERNALGLVKFMFPNKHAVYFHDTPAKYLFKKRDRAFSHGCMRVHLPMQLANVLLARDQNWNMGKVKWAAHEGPDNNRVMLRKKIPVHVTYFTARVDEDGEIKLVGDVYGHEPLIQKGLDGKAHTIVKEDRSLDKYLEDRIGEGNVYAENRRYRRRQQQYWFSNIWGYN